MADLPDIPGAAMSPREWIELAALIDAWWPATDFTADSELAYWLELARFDREAVEGAVRGCLADGKPFAPSLAEILARLDGASQLPSPIEAVASIESAMRRFGVAREAEAIGELAEGHAVVADFAATYGWSTLCMEQLADPVYGQATRERLRRAYADHAARREMRLASASAHRGALASRERLGLRRPDVRGLLGEGPEA